jgi:hypothetical protein
MTEPSADQPRASDSKPETKATPKPEAKAEPKPEAKAEPEANTDVATLMNTTLGDVLLAGLAKDPESVGRIVAAAITQAEASIAITKAPEADAKPDAKAEPQPEAKAEPKPEAKAKTSPDSTPKIAK